MLSANLHLFVESVVSQNAEEENVPDLGTLTQLMAVLGFLNRITTHSSNSSLMINPKTSGQSEI